MKFLLRVGDSKTFLIDGAAARYALLLYSVILNFVIFKLRFFLFTFLAVTSFTVFFLWLKYEDITAFDDSLHNNGSAHIILEDRQDRIRQLGFIAR